MERDRQWAEKRSTARYANSILDSEFDEEPAVADPYERLVFGEFDGDMGGRPDRGGKVGRSCDARRKRRTVRTDDAEVVTLPEAPPPGWADP